MTDYWKYLIEVFTTHTTHYFTITLKLPARWLARSYCLYKSNQNILRQMKRAPFLNGK